MLACAVDPQTGSIAVVDACNVPDVDNDVRDTIQVRLNVDMNTMDITIRSTEPSSLLHKFH